MENRTYITVLLLNIFGTLIFLFYAIIISAFIKINTNSQLTIILSNFIIILSSLAAIILLYSTYKLKTDNVIYYNITLILEFIVILSFFLIGIINIIIISAFLFYGLSSYAIIREKKTIYS